MDRIRTQILTCRTRWFKKWTFRTELCYYSLVASNGRNLYTTGKRAKIVFLTVQIHCPEKIQPCVGSHPTKKATLLGGLNGGGGGIRTHGTLARTTVFKTAPINRSGTPPSNCFECIIIIPIQDLLSRRFFKNF